MINPAYRSGNNSMNNSATGFSKSPQNGPSFDQTSSQNSHSHNSSILEMGTTKVLRTAGIHY